VAINVTVVQTGAAGSLTLYPGDQALPLASTINFSRGATRANNQVVALSRAGVGTINIYSLSAGATHVLLDVTGYFQSIRPQCPCRRRPARPERSGAAAPASTPPPSPRLLAETSSSRHILRTL
jgi:hypothetical protein